MATKEVSTLSGKVITTVVTALAEGIATAKNSAGALIAFCTAAAKAGLPKTMPEPDVVAIVDALSLKLGWNGTPREKVSKSEARSLVRQHALLPEAITAMRAKTGSCGYHDAVKVARAIKEHGNIGDAILALTTRKEVAKADPQIAVARALKTWYGAVRDSNKSSKRSNLLKIIGEFAAAADIDLGNGTSL